jgi:hypothetical protein
MNIQKEIAELKSAFSALGEEIKMRFNDEPAPIQFGELTLVDGTIIKYEGDAPAIGSALIVVTPEGEVPAPDGVHETDSGLLIQTEGGVITEIEEKEMQVEAGKKEEEKPAEFATLENFETYRASVEERMANLEKTLISMLGKVEETFAVFEKFSNQTPAPTEKPFGHTKVEKNEALAGFASAFKNLKK